MSAMLRLIFALFIVLFKVGVALSPSFLGKTRSGIRSATVHVPLVFSQWAVPLKKEEEPKRVLQTSIKLAKTNLTFKNLKIWTTKTLWPKIIAFIASVGALVKLLRSETSRRVLELTSGKKSPKLLPAAAAVKASLPVVKPSVPKITSTLLPIDAAKSVVKKQLEEQLVKTPSPAAPALATLTTTATAETALQASTITTEAVGVATPEVAAVAESTDSSTGGSTMERIKSLGTSGIIAYVISEIGFWSLALPTAYVSYHAETGAWLSPLTDEADRAKVLALTLTFVTGARLLVPVRISIALALVPLVDWLRGNQEEEKQ